MPITDVTVKLMGEDGNAFAIMGAVTRAMRRKGVEDEVINQYRNEATSGGYDHLLSTTVKYVTVV